MVARSRGRFPKVAPARPYLKGGLHHGSRPRQYPRFRSPQSSSTHFVLTERRLAANRRNARYSTGPRTAEGKAKIARNPIKHGFFVAQEKWRPSQCRDFEELHVSLCEEFQPRGDREAACVATIAASYVRMAAMLRWENLAALKYHQQCERELNARIDAADEVEAARLEAHRESLRAAGLWGPTLPGPREANAIIRYLGRLDRAIRRSMQELDIWKKLRTGDGSLTSKVKKQTHSEASPTNALGHGEGPRWPRKWEMLLEELEKQSHFRVATAESENAKANPLAGSTDECPQALRRALAEVQVGNETEKTNPLTSMFTGNRHERRRARALAARRR